MYSYSKIFGNVFQDIVRQHDSHDLNEICSRHFENQRTEPRMSMKRTHNETYTVQMAVLTSSAEFYINDLFIQKQTEFES